MKEIMKKLIDLKSIITILLTVGMVLLLCGVFNPSDAVFALYSTVYGSVMTYYFTRKSKDGE